MFTASSIRRHIFRLPEERIFTTRELLVYGTRNEVDMTLSRLVKKGTIIRLARGVFVKSGSDIQEITAFMIAKAKAEAFEKRICLDGINSLDLLELRKAEKENPINCYITDGSFSRFESVKGTIVLKTASPRKLRLLNHFLGLFIRAIWFLGNRSSSKRPIRAYIELLSKHEIDSVRLAAALMPDWMASMFPWYGREKWYGDPVFWYKSIR